MADGGADRANGWGGVVMWWFVLFIGFLMAATQSFFYQTFNGLSLVGMMMMLLATGFILTRGMEE